MDYSRGNTYTHAADDQGMFFGLALQSRLEAVFLGVDNQDSEVGLGHTSNHVGNEVSVAWRVKDGEACVLCFEGHSSDIHCHTATSLLVCLIHEPRKSEG